MLYRIHMDHCIFVLLTNIQCMSDVTPVLFEADSLDTEAWKPHSAPHLCRRYDVLLDWIKDHSVNTDTGNGSFNEDRVLR